MNPSARLSHESTSTLPAAEPMTRTDSGFEDYQKSSPPGSSPSETTHDAFSTTTAEASSGTPNHRPSPLSRHQSRSTITAAISAPATPERPPLRKRRSRPSSKHSVRSSSRSSTVYPRPSLSGRVRSFPVELAMHHRSDLDSVLALHSRSCSIFNSSFTPTSAPQSPGLSSLGRPSTDMSRHSLQVDRNSLRSIAHQDPAHFYPMPSPALSDFSSLAEEDAAAAEVSTPTVPPPTVMHWNSPSTRRREYAEIDRSTKGFRGFMRRVTPRWLSRRPPRQAFYDGEKEDDDACSVRRYRIDVPDEDDADASTAALEEKHRPMSAPTTRKARFWKGQ